MDKSWMSKSRVSDQYVKGAKQFVEFAFFQTINSQVPCKKCVNYYFLSSEEVYEHLIVHGIMEHYTSWKEHEESYLSFESYIPNINDMLRNDYTLGWMLHEAFGMSSEDEELSDVGGGTSGRNAKADDFFNLLKDVDQELYPGCKKNSKLSFLVRLYHIKCLSGWSNKSFNMLLAILKETLPEGETLPKSFYETKKIISELGLNYENVDACPNDCMLYWKEDVNEEVCKICGISRWKIVGHLSDDEADIFK